MSLSPPRAFVNLVAVIVAVYSGERPLLGIAESGGTVGLQRGLAAGPGLVIQVVLDRK